MTAPAAATAWLTPDAAAAYAGMSTRSITAAITRGELRSRKVGQMRRTRATWVDAWIEAHDDQGRYIGPVTTAAS